MPRLAAEEARRFLLTTDFPPSKVDAVYGAIRVHEGLYKDERLGQLEAAILWDADKLSKLGATYLVHSLCSRPAFDPIFQGRPTDTELVVESLRRWLDIGAEDRRKHEYRARKGGGAASPGLPQGVRTRSWRPSGRGRYRSTQAQL